MNLVVRLLAWLLITLAALARGTARADQICDEVLVDFENVLGNERTTIERHAEQLTRLGALVRVRSLDTTNGLTFGEWVTSTQSACESWRSDRLIAILVATTDRNSAILYGTHWKTILDPHRDKILQEVVVPEMNHDRWAAGLVAGIDQLVRTVRDPDASIGGPRAPMIVVVVGGSLLVTALLSLATRRRGSGGRPN